MSTILILCLSCSSYGQSKDQKVIKKDVFQTFKDTRVINAHSVETLKSGMMDFRIGHRFGDLAGDNGGWSSFYGLESAEDVLFGFEFGLSDRFMVGLSRTNGGLFSLVEDNSINSIKLPGANVNGFFKYKLATQNNVGTPFSIALVGHMTASTEKKSASESDLTFFAKTEHRFSYHAEFITARKVSNYFSFQFSGSWTYRNIVPTEDKNDLVSIGLAARIQMSRSMALILDGRYTFSEFRAEKDNYYAPIGIGFEWETGGGHVFQINLTNATGLVETDYIPYTRSNWLDGEFRLGFTIGRQFKL